MAGNNVIENEFINILHVEDDDGDARHVARQCKTEFQAGNYAITHVAEMYTAKQLLRKKAFSVVLLDLELGDGMRLENLSYLKESYPDLPVVLLSGHDDTQSALDAVRAGAQEYLIKSHCDSRTLYLAILSSIERMRHERQLFTMATHDELTGLHNRRAFVEYLMQEFRRAIRWERPVCIMFIDVNGFKDVNDTYGHDIGDALLIHVSNTLKRGLRACDMLARLAGDEFVVHLDGELTTMGQDCKTIAEKISALFEEPVRIGDIDLTTSVSIGIAYYPGDGTNVDELMVSADKAMYHAKQNKLPYCYFNQIDKST